MQVEIVDEALSKMVAEDLLWHSEQVEDARLRKALRKVAFYYMTYDEVVQYTGCTETAKEVFYDQ